MSAIPQHEVDDWKRLTSMIDNLQNDRISDKHHAQERKVHDVTLKLSGDEETLKKLEKKAKKEAKDVKSISKPGFKRFGARIGGHLDEKTEKEKKEAVAAQNAVEKKQEEIQREKKELEQLTQALQHLSVQAGSLKTAEKDRKNLIKQ
ncbi:hypothetical protein SARC_04269 [Sphaeroforma arctica JP610]|uniref:Uncharacterized protein n=1 Tax=Sphaeroforma arctica JP610 TaxID=667725 RepID=A0A0L0G5F5_9EUKA|nr:hypothetical protein SARC_04269 [Sphaeroforma arctica JP610]KNC83488.1 hypothetical protein SARC_04269 [Sphaeroforma arctica JP610]|eukprot:XP_014157390.1 hypothetical protein SARC_04269 [Sphaeroforma arctica JP610]